MGTKFISIILILVLITSGFIVTNTFANSDEDVRATARTADFDNSFETAKKLFNNTTFSNTVDSEDDIFDYYKLTLDANSVAGDLLTITLELDYSFDAVYLFVYNPEKYCIIDDFVWPLFTGDYQKSICACTKGTYYIVIGAYSGETKYYLTPVFYSISREIDCDNCNDEATTAVNEVIYSGSLNATYDYLDLYKVSINCSTDTTEALTVELSYFEDKYLAVYNPDGTMREYSDIIYGTQGDKEIIEFAADQTGYYHIVVGISGEPDLIVSYSLKTIITSNVPPDNDYDRDHALLVYNGTKLNSSFDSDFDEYDYYMIDLIENDCLTVSLLYIDGSGTTFINILDEDDYNINDDDDFDSDKGCWASAVAEYTGRYYIEVENWWYYLGKYTILFSTCDENLWFPDIPISINDTNLDFNMLEDTVDESHVNLYDIFYDPDSPIEFSSPSHPKGTGENIDIELLDNGMVRFKPHENFFGYEIVEFKAVDVKLNKLYWEVNVTVLSVNDPPRIISIGGENVTNDTVKLFATQNVNGTYDLEIYDPDNTEYLETIYYPTPGTPGDLDFRWVPDYLETFTIIESGPFITFKPENAQVGTFYVNVTVYDTVWQKPSPNSELEKYESANHTVMIEFTIENSNDPPLFTKIGDTEVFFYEWVYLTAYEDTWNNFSVEAADVDHDVGVMDVLRFSHNLTDPAFIIDNITGNISFLPRQKHVGILYAQLFVDDDKGGRGELCVSINVINVNDPPLAPAITIDDANYLQVIFSAGEAYDEDGDKLTYYWNFGDNSSIDTSRFVVHTFPEAGNYTVTVTVEDVWGGYSNATLDVVVEEAPPKGSGKDNGDEISILGNQISIIMFLILMAIIITILVAAGVGVFLYRKKRRRESWDYYSPRQPTTQQNRARTTAQAQRQPEYHYEQRRVSESLTPAQTYAPSYEKPQADLPPPQQPPPQVQVQPAPVQEYQGYQYPEYIATPSAPPPVEPEYPQIQPPAQPESQPTPIEQPTTPVSSPQQKIQLLEERLLLGEITQDLYLNLKAKYEAELETYQPPAPSELPPEYPPEQMTTPTPGPTTYASPPEDGSIPTQSQEPSYSNCPICGAQIIFGAAICQNCNTPLSW